MPFETLAEVDTEALAIALANRIPSQGFMPKPIFDLVVAAAPIICVDGVAWRRNALTRRIEVLAIRRNTGEAAGKLCLVGGRVLGGLKREQPESIDAALRRHFKTDLGVEIEFDWRQPFRVGQTAPNGGPGFEVEKVKHAVAMRFLVALESTDFIFGEGAAGKEAKEVVWLTEETLGDCTGYGYDHHDAYSAALKLLSGR